MSSKNLESQRSLKKVSKTHLTWNGEAEVVGVAIEIETSKTLFLTPQYKIGLHAWFLDRVRQSDPDLSRVLHDEQAEKAFTLSELEGESVTEGKEIRLASDRVYCWTITGLSTPVTQWLASWMKKLPKTIRLHYGILPISNTRIVLPPTTYRQLWDKAGTAKGSLKLSFLTPSSFRRQGHHFPLPVPINLFQSYLRRWNVFSGMPFESVPFLEWVDRSVIILRHTLSSAKVLAGKRGSLTGFTGAIELSLSKSAYREPEFVQLFYALAEFAPYCGTGHKTPFGLGQTRLGWLLPEIKPEIKEVASMQSLIAERIEHLTTVFLAHRKRLGGTRSIKMAQTLATILARREMGESLQEIALDLEMPYETVKTYAKRARRELK